MNKFLNGLSNATNYTYTENGALAYKSTQSKLLDMFALGGAYRTRSEEDVILLFKNAYEENEAYALKCLFYLGDVRGGQGERRFFRVCMKWLAKNHTETARRNMRHIPEFRRWDDLYVLVGTPLEKEMFQFMKEQLALDVQSKTPSLLAKWMKSENTSSPDSRALANKTRIVMGMSHKQYRKTLSILRERINVLERLMSAGKWDEIEFDKIPSRAGMIYKNAFARHDIERAKSEKNVQTYSDFAKDTTKKVNAKVLYPYECVSEAMKVMRANSWWYSDSNIALDDTNRLMVNKYWDNLADYFKGATFNGMAIVDTSGSMCGSTASAPINVAISLGMYCAEKAKGPFAGHFMTFSNSPTFVKVEGVDFCDKVKRMGQANWGMNTNIEAAFDLMLYTALRNKCTQDEIPKSLIIISDMEFDRCAACGPCGNDSYYDTPNRVHDKATLMERIRRRWENAGYEMPVLTFWNCQARQNNIPMRAEHGINFVSGMSPAIFEQVMQGKDAYELMMDKLNTKRYEVIG